MHTPIEKKIYPTASAQTVSGVGCPVPFKYWSIPLSAPSRVRFLKTMIRMKMNGAGTVNHTMYDELCTPLNTAKKHVNQTTMVEKNAGTENYEGSPSLYGLH